MNQEWYTRLLWNICEKLGHFGWNKSWEYNDKIHTNCKLCKRVVSKEKEC